MDKDEATSIFPTSIVLSLSHSRILSCGDGEEFQLHELHCIQGRVRNNVNKAVQVTAEEVLDANKILEGLLKENQQGDSSVLLHVSIALI